VYTISTLVETPGIAVRKFASYREEVLSAGGREADGPPLVKVAVAAVIANPFPGRFQEDVMANEPPSAALCRALCERAVTLAGGEVESFGKGAIVGTAGDQEQGVSFLASAFGDALRDAAGGEEWVSSVTKRGAPGAAIDIPLAHKTVLRARSHYDAISIAIPDAPAADEIVVVVGMASRSRLNERCGGYTVEEGLTESGAPA
jgi:Amino acid synthesis